MDFQTCSDKIDPITRDYFDEDDNIIYFYIDDGGKTHPKCYSRESLIAYLPHMPFLIQGDKTKNIVFTGRKRELFKMPVSGLYIRKTDIDKIFRNPQSQHWLLTDLKKIDAGSPVHTTSSLKIATYPFVGRVRSLSDIQVENWRSFWTEEEDEEEEEKEEIVKPQRKNSKSRVRNSKSEVDEEEVGEEDNKPESSKSRLAKPEVLNIRRSSRLVSSTQATEMVSRPIQQHGININTRNNTQERDQRARRRKLAAEAASEAAEESAAAEAAAEESAAAEAAVEAAAVEAAVEAAEESSAAEAVEAAETETEAESESEAESEALSEAEAEVEAEAEAEVEAEAVAAPVRRRRTRAQTIFRMVDYENGHNALEGTVQRCTRRRCYLQDITTGVRRRINVDDQGRFVFQDNGHFVHIV